MITIEIDFYDKKTEFIAYEKKIECPDHLVFTAVENDKFSDNELDIARAENKQIDYINARPFAVTMEMKAYAIEHYPELKEKFDQYDYSFIGRHGLGPEYD
jgi:hypothetical protein